MPNSGQKQTLHEMMHPAPDAGQDKIIHLVHDLNNKLAVIIGARELGMQETALTGCNMAQSILNEIAAALKVEIDADIERIKAEKHKLLFDK